MMKGQGTFEYILLLAGILLIVVLAIVLLRGGLFTGTSSDVRAKTCKTKLAEAGGCYLPNTGWNTDGVAAPSIAACEPIATSIANDACTSAAATGAYNNTGYCCGLSPT